MNSRGIPKIEKPPNCKKCGLQMVFRDNCWLCIHCGNTKEIKLKEG